MRYDSNDRESVNVIDLRLGEESLVDKIYREGSRFLKRMIEPSAQGTGSEKPSISDAPSKPAIGEGEQLRQVSPVQSERGIPKQEPEIGQKWLDEQLKRSIFPGQEPRGIVIPEEKDPNSSANEGKLEQKNSSEEGTQRTNETQSNPKPPLNSERTADVKDETSQEVEPKVMADRMEKMPDFTPFEAQSNQVQQQTTHLDMTSPY